jgi:ABC-2 type transport system ATP-binding protein
MIEASELTRTYGPLRAVDRLSFQVPKGSVCGFLGPNGAGKSTTIRMITGLFPPDSGRLMVGGLDVVRTPLASRRLIGYLPESTPLDPELRVEEYLRFRGRLCGLKGRDLKAAIGRSADRCGLESVRRRLIGALSKGFRQRVGLAAALLADPPLLILDEPTVGLDPSQQAAFRSLLGALSDDRTVLLSSHLLAEVEASCTWLVMISSGRLVATGSRESILEQVSGSPVIAEVLKADAPAFQAKVQALVAVAEVGIEDLEPGWSRLRILSADGSDLREVILGMARDMGIRLRELRQQRQNLESVFLALEGGASGGWSPAVSEDAALEGDLP